MEAMNALLRELAGLKDIPDEMWNRGFVLYQKFETYSSLREMEDELIRFACSIRERNEFCSDKQWNAGY